MPAGTSSAGAASGALLVAGDAGFDAAHRLEVFVHLAAIIGPQSALQVLGVFEHQIENVLTIRRPAVRGLGRLPSEKSRSKTRRGLISLAFGVDSLRQETLAE